MTAQADCIRSVRGDRDMDDVRATLIAAAKAVCGTFSWGNNDASAGAVGAAILTAQGHIYTGICIDLACVLGSCAEVAAIAEGSCWIPRAWMCRWRTTQLLSCSPP